MIAYAPVDEEQGRKTLHRHWQVWVTELDMKLRQNLFHNDAKIKLSVCHKLQKYVDQIMSITFGPDLVLKKNTERVSYCIDTSLQNF